MWCDTKQAVRAQAPCSNCLAVSPYRLASRFSSPKQGRILLAALPYTSPSWQWPYLGSMDSALSTMATLAKAQKAGSSCVLYCSMSLKKPRM